MSRSLDNRLGSYVVLGEAARRLATAGRRASPVDVVAVAAAQEEIGSVGACCGVRPQILAVAIAVDVTPATDHPGGDPRRAGRVELGMGAMIARGPTLNKLVSELLADAAAAEAIPHGFEVYTRQTATDADEFHSSRAGVPTGLVSIPMRYLHTPNELCDLDYVEAEPPVGRDGGAPETGGRSCAERRRPRPAGAAARFTLCQPAS